VRRGGVTISESSTWIGYRLVPLGPRLCGEAARPLAEAPVSGLHSDSLDHDGGFREDSDGRQYTSEDDRTDEA